MMVSAKRFGIVAFAVLILLGYTAPANALKTGAAAPDVQAQAAINGKVAGFDLHKELQKNAVVLYFFPKAFTQG